MSTDLTLDPDFDKQAVFQLLAKFNLSAGDMAEVFASYLTLHPPTFRDLAALRGALKQRGTSAQIELLRAAGRLLNTEEIAEKLGLASRQSVHNLKARKKLLAISFENRRGDYFPEFQLDGSAVREWVAPLLQRISDGWSALAFLTAGRREFNGASYLTRVLQHPPAADELLAAADAYVS
ncbi:MAG: hypothetical protein PHC88_16690 [Terrimicrobiaceae bacterium]|nr:hypothetical protein [Terrimicrobiaceae bacterium]